MAEAHSFHACDSPSHEGVTNTWFTPVELIISLGAAFDLDPCSQSFRPFDTAATVICEDLGGDGLALSWEGRVWMNPPYGREIESWLEKLRKHGNGIALVFSRTETAWAQKHIRSADAVNFMKGRISFVRADGAQGTNAANGSMLLAYGRENVEAIRRVPGLFFDNLEKG